MKNFGLQIESHFHDLQYRWESCLLYERHRKSKKTHQQRKALLDSITRTRALLDELEYVVQQEETLDQKVEEALAEDARGETEEISGDDWGS